ncbi:MAG TPA: Hsp20/alpha crystallin family protein [Candidatus Paceibacterota bacterium]|nr:Hsp20/alpha crystallin family protein [Candidatus Paceibacterota bacterium]HOK20851.1 Hsp20/alpha crystallin family protein [Candidatus Paceibacterota bacterium]HOL53739.1 Hsp20/alpha crystallin family protein [Candidatus Paceibacterota bacterium]HON21958.1 Hsp20/alpha crystallin family protein [Candidatus Paceibacterota bacterium]HOV88650.1 Hsp20/alpha crystallin family protein [Candidatus Paceibacterota bacterium]
MKLVPRNPFEDLEKWFEDEDWALPIVPSSAFKEPAMDIYQTEKDVIAELNIPGFDPKKIEVSVNNQVLTVKGEMQETEEEKKRDYWRKEIRKGSFERMVRLPAEVDENKVEATYEKGVLKIVMPKKESSTQTKKIPIKTKD